MYKRRRSARLTHSQSVSRSVSQSVSQSVGLSVSQSVSQSFSRPVRQSVSQPVSQPDSQSVSQSVSPHLRGPTSRRHKTPSPETGEGGQRPCAAWATTPGHSSTQSCLIYFCPYVVLLRFLLKSPDPSFRAHRSDRSDRSCSLP